MSTPVREPDKRPSWMVKGADVVVYRDGPNAFVRTGTIGRIYERSVSVLDHTGASYRFDIGSLNERTAGAWTQHYTKLGPPDDERALRIAARVKIGNHINTLERWQARQPDSHLDEKAQTAVAELALLIPAFIREK